MMILCIVGKQIFMLFVLMGLRQTFHGRAGDTVLF